MYQRFYSYKNTLMHRIKLHFITIAEDKTHFLKVLQYFVPVKQKKIWKINNFFNLNVKYKFILKNLITEPY